MKLYIKISVLFLILVSSSISFAQNSLKVATYNIQGMKPGTEPATRIQHIINKFIELDPDIIGLQEINEDKAGDNSDNQALRIANALSTNFGIPYSVYYEQTHESWDNQFREFIGIITKLPVLKKEFQNLTSGVFPRKVVWNYIDTEFGKINFFTSHLSFNNSATRRIQVDEILNYAGFLNSIKSNIANILTGDFNDIPDSASIKKLTNGSYLATYTEANPDWLGHTMPSGSAFKKIDYIFIDKFSKLQIDTSYIIMDEPYDGINYNSDHLGIMTIFSNPTVSIEEVTVPTTFALSQNYPNPFNPCTTIQYEISEIGDVSINVYDILGNEITQIVNAEQQPGSYQIDFDGSSLSNGIYFYQVETDKYSEIRKMTILK